MPATDEDEYVPAWHMMRASFILGLKKPVPTGSHWRRTERFESMIEMGVTAFQQPEMQGPVVESQYGCSADTVIMGRRRRSAAAAAGMLMVEKAVFILGSCSLDCDDCES
jgi:hypothetical protein